MKESDFRDRVVDVMEEPLERIGKDWNGGMFRPRRVVSFAEYCFTSQVGAEFQI